MAVPLAALGLCDSSALFLCRLLSTLMVSSRCPVGIIINSEHKSARLSKWYLLSNNCPKIQYKQQKLEASFHLRTFLPNRNTSWNECLLVVCSSSEFILSHHRDQVFSQPDSWVTSVIRLSNLHIPLFSLPFLEALFIGMLLLTFPSASLPQSILFLRQRNRKQIFSHRVHNSVYLTYVEPWLSRGKMDSAVVKADVQTIM